MCSWYGMCGVYDARVWVCVGCGCVRTVRDVLCVCVWCECVGMCMLRVCLNGAGVCEMQVYA